MTIYTRDGEYEETEDEKQYRETMEKLRAQAKAPDSINGEGMCETIEGVRRMLGEKAMAPLDIWNASPTGELFHVYVGYNEAMLYLSIVGKTVDEARELGRTPIGPYID